MGCANKSLGMAQKCSFAKDHRYPDRRSSSILRLDFEPNKAYLNYPTQVIFKCCNLIPVMIGGMLIQKKVYNRFDFIAVLLMTIGLIFFTLGDSESSPDFNTTGVRLKEIDHRLSSVHR